MSSRNHARLSPRIQLALRIGVAILTVLALSGAVLSFNLARVNMSVMDALISIIPGLLAVSLPLAFYVTFGKPIWHVATVSLYCIVAALNYDDYKIGQLFLILALVYGFFVFARDRTKISRRGQQKPPSETSHDYVMYDDKEPHEDALPLDEPAHLEHTLCQPPAAAQEPIFYVAAAITLLIGIYLSSIAYEPTGEIGVGLVFTVVAMTFIVPGLLIIRARGIDVRNIMPKLSRSVDQGITAAKTHENHQHQENLETAAPSEKHHSDVSTMPNEESK